jgi:acetylornithine deacetylase/succinyl-diaminopimelate desuccinylase-like protein
VLEAHHAQGLALPVNLRFCFEGMEECGSEGLDEFVFAEAKRTDGWFSGVDCICIVSVHPSPRACARTADRSHRATTTG